MKLPWKTMETNQKPWKTMKLPWKPWKPTKNHEKPWNHLEKPWKPTKTIKTMVLRYVTNMKSQLTSMIKKRHVTNTGSQPTVCMTLYFCQTLNKHHFCRKNLHILIIFKIKITEFHKSIMSFVWYHPLLRKCFSFGVRASQTEAKNKISSRSTLPTQCCLMCRKIGIVVALVSFQPLCSYSWTAVVRIPW